MCFSSSITYLSQSVTVTHCVGTTKHIIQLFLDNMLCHHFSCLASSIMWKFRWGNISTLLHITVLHFHIQIFFKNVSYNKNKCKEKKYLKVWRTAVKSTVLTSNRTCDCENLHLTFWLKKLHQCYTICTIFPCSLQHRPITALVNLL